MTRTSKMTLVSLLAVAVVGFSVSAVTPAQARGGLGLARPTMQSIEYITVEPAPSESIVIAIPEASGRSREASDRSGSGITLSLRQNDFESCYRSAAGQVARDARIDNDRREMREDSDDVVGLTTFLRRVDFYSQTRRRARLFDGCMRAKGNTRR